MPYGDRPGDRPMLAVGADFNQGGVGMVADKVGQRITRGDYAAFAGSIERASIIAALHLYLDFINLFLFLLRLMGSRR